MVYKKKPIVGRIIRIIILVIVVLFVIACYKIEFFKNNTYIAMAKEKVNGAIDYVSAKASDCFYALFENYEPDEFDENLYVIEDAENRYYYNQLDDNSKIIYAEILHNLDRLKDGEDNIRISSRLSSLADSDDMNAALMGAFQNAWDAFRNDDVDVFYLDGTKMCLVTKTIKRGRKIKYEFYISKGKNPNYFIDGFYSRAQVENAEKYVKKSEEEILNSITDKDDYNKIMQAHNWIVDNVSYNTDESNNNANLYGALYDKKVVCEGYARLFKSLMDKMDIPCVFVSGVGISGEKTEDHAWNYVLLKGEWYAVDVTWDDPIIIGNGSIAKDIKYKYFLKGSKYFADSHKEEGKLVENGMTFEYPKISQENYGK